MPNGGNEGAARQLAVRGACAAALKLAQQANYSSAEWFGQLNPYD